jgi:ankyrin repeat protein
MAENNPSPSVTLGSIDPNNIATTGPYAGLPVLPEGMVWSQFPWNSKFVEDPDWYDSLGLDMLERRQVFKTTDNEELQRKLEEILREFPHKGMDILFQACVKRRPDVVRWCLGKGVRAHPVPGEDDETCVPIHAAAYNGCLECAKILVEEGGVSVNAKDDMGGTPVMRAAKGKHSDIVRWLIEKGADLTQRDTTDQGEVSALDYAVLGGDVNTVR